MIFALPQMELNDYPTNILAFNNFTSINFEYLEPQTLSTWAARKHLQRLEAEWRREGRLVHCDPYRDGIWLFYNTPNTSIESSSKEIDFNSKAPDFQSKGLVQRDKGVYEPANFARNRPAISNSLSTPSSSSSPSSSLEATLRNSQTLNARSVQSNSSVGAFQEPPTPSPGAKPDIQSSLKDVHEHFISAVLGSIVYFLCRDHNFIPLNSRTLVFGHYKPVSTLRSIPTSSTIELATLDISLTSLGSLVVKAHADIAPGLQSLTTLPGLGSRLDKLAPGAALWLAPSGYAAKYHSSPEDKQAISSISQLQINQDVRPSVFNSLTIKSWQSKCLDWLSAKGLDASTLESGGWLFVQVLGGYSPYSNTDFQGIPMLEEMAIVPWPALLCFQTSASANRGLDSFTIGSARDPLSFAEEWFSGREERANTSAKRQREIQAAEASTREQAEVEARALQSSIYSPAALRRGSNSGAMYPTPPDAPHHPVGATPSFDGNVSTPGHPTPFLPHEPVAPIPGHQSSTDVEADAWVSSGKKARIGSANHFNENENENLFDDLGDNIFEDITDADFNFFDVPDTVDFDQKRHSPDLTALKDPGTTHDMPAPTATQTTVLQLHGSDIKHESHNPRVVEAASEDLKTLLSKPNPRQDPLSNLPVTKQNVSSVADEAAKPQERHPFNKEVVFKRLTRESTIVLPARRSSLFDTVGLEKSLVSIDKKYGTHGPFNFPVRKSSRIQGDPSASLRGSCLAPQGKDEWTNGVSNIARLLTERVQIQQSDFNEPMDFMIGSDCGSQTSEHENSSHEMDESIILPKSGIKRKWESQDGDQITFSLDALAVETDHPASTPHSLNGSQMPLLDADPADWSLSTYFTSMEPEVQSNTLSDLERIATAQILTDQAISGTLQLPRATVALGGDTTTLTRTSTTKELMYRLVKATRSCLKDIHACTLRSYLDIQGIPILNQGLRLPPRPITNPRSSSNMDQTRPNNPFLISAPQLEVRRSESKLSVLPAAVAFWENLGLGPARGNKDIHSVCVFPNFEGVAANCQYFLDQMRSVYESSRFGSHDRLDSKDLANGLLPVAIDIQPQNKIHHQSILKETMTRLSRIISSLPVDEKNFVVYFVYPADDSTLLVNICSAFQHLFNSYRKALSEKRINATNELVLQLIPMDLISYPTTLSVPNPTQYFRLAMEVYDRCIDFNSSSSSPAIMLEQPLPKNIDFKLSVTPSASLLQENTCLHVAYAQSIDDRWITAAWTDNRGTQQMTASYCLGRKNEPISMPFSTIAAEIWETTLDFILSKKIHWRIIIARVGVMDPSELEFWTGLAATESDARINLTLITVQTEPSLQLLPASITLTPNASVAHSVNTPVSTPQSLQSPPARETPNVAALVDTATEPDGDARLLDATDQSWGAVLSHRLNNSNSLMDVNLALISGYLLKRGGPGSDDPPLVLEVNIVHCDVVGNPRTFHEYLLREILIYYRGLGTLARVRGIVDSVRDVRPWHIAAAEKAVKALYMLM